MLLHGDEIGRTQQGNNNGYCQDNELTWMDWEQVDDDMLEFVRKVSALRREHPVFRRRRFFEGRPVRRRGGPALPDIEWFTPNGREMTEEDWDSGFGRSIGVYLNGQGIAERDSRGQAVADDSFLMYFNAHDDKIDFHLPEARYAGAWVVEVDTRVGSDREATIVQPDTVVSVGPRSMVVLRSVGR
jgi:glycogen operon protein